MSATPTAEEALGVMRSLVARQDPSSPPPATPTPLLRRGLQPGPPGVLLAPDLALMVTRDAVGLFSVQDAKVHCDILSLAGFSDWRLPSIIELDQLTTSPRLPANRGQVRALWSSSIHDISGNLLLVLPQRSIVHQSAGSAHVVCVRSMVD